MTAPKLRVIPLGGLGEVGKNMTVVEWDGHAVIVDAGVRFPTPEMHGIDLIVPDFSYLEDADLTIEAIVITHGHEDHLGGLPWVMRRLGEEAVGRVFGRKLTAAMARSKLDEHDLRTSIEEIEPGQVAQAGPFEIELIHLTHSIPDAAAVALTCPLGTILFTGDYRFDQTPVDGNPSDISRLARLGDEGLLLLCGDSTNAGRPGFASSEADVGPEIEAVFARCSGRIVVTSFASNIHRVQQVIDAATALGRKVALVGRSMVKNVNIGRDLGHVHFPQGVIVNPRKMRGIPDEEMVIVTTGSQGEPLAALQRMAYGEHRDVKLHAGDTIVYSANPIPGNERAVAETINRLTQIGCDVVTAQDAAIHTSGHGHREELKLMLNVTRPQYLMPVHGDHRMLRLHAELAEAVGIPAERILHADNGLPVEIDRDGARLGEAVTSGMFLIDGLELGDPAESALRDRRRLSGDGIIMIAGAVSADEGRVLGPCEVELRGVATAEGEEEFLSALADAVEVSLERATEGGVREAEVLERRVHDDAAKFVYERLRRRPLILPMIVEA